MNTLLKKAQQHDAESFVALMQEHTKDMYKISYAILSNSEDAADAMQDTILTCWKKLGTLKHDDYFKSWLTRILINNCNTILRTQTDGRGLLSGKTEGYQMNKNEKILAAFCSIHPARRKIA